jgi:hypothetical protein
MELRKSGDDLMVDGIAFPTINESLLALMGLSNAGYLGTKAVTHTQTTSLVPAARAQEP